ncbi:MAG: sulfite exporter TauE/SafE family protein [Hyphomicrobiaceae bacterium]|nr:sulfite exporter TauE/SafE family protein [Hyphomicrobiaceae bacterium]
MSLPTILILIAGALAGGFVSGLAGFGMALVTLGIWLHVVAPEVAVTAILICSVVAQASTIRTIWHVLDPKRVLPFIIPGLVGVPLGSMLLGSVEPGLFKQAMGYLLIAFSTFMLTWRRPMRMTWGGKPADAVIGFIGGIMGGFAGLSGPMPTIWATLRGWSKDEKRSVFQAFNITMLGAALLANTVAGRLTNATLMVAAIAVPAALIGARVGVYTYPHLSDRRFTDIVLVLMGLSGLFLITSH